MTNLNNIHYEEKYLKYKTKYTELKQIEQLGGSKYTKNGIFCFFTTKIESDAINMKFEAVKTQSTNKRNLVKKLFGEVLQILNNKAYVIEDGDKILRLVNNKINNKMAPTGTPVPDDNILNLELPENDVFNRCEHIINVLKLFITYSGRLSFKPYSLIIIKNSTIPHIIATKDLTSKADIIQNIISSNKKTLSAKLIELNASEATKAGAGEKPK
jgi:hypothetical protein